MPPKIRELVIRPVLVPMPQPHQTASGTVADSPLVLLTIHTDQGIAGHSITFTYTPAALRPTAELMTNIAPLIVGDEVAPEEVAQKLAKKFRLLGTQGLMGMALAGIDMALWDAVARLHDVSLVRLLGGVEKPVQVYGAGGFDGPLAAAKVAEDWARRGVRGVKAKIGYATVEEDLATIRAMRSATGPEVAIMVDYNQSLTPDSAIERLRHLDGEGLTWIEEPTLSHDFKGNARIAEAIATPIQCGENWWGELDVRQAIDAKASDYIMLDVMKTGGVTGWMRAAARCAAHGIRLSNHLWPEISAQLLCVSGNAHWLEYADWWNPAIEEPLRIENGMSAIDGVKGSGVSFKEG